MEGPFGVQTHFTLFAYFALNRATTYFQAATTCAGPPLAWPFLLPLHTYQLPLILLLDPEKSAFNQG
jgi:hypothetical protein